MKAKDLKLGWGRFPDGKDLKLGWGRFPDGMEVIYLYDRGDDNFGYAANLQAASGIIIAAALTNTAPDVGHLPDLVDGVRKLRDHAGRPPDDATTVSADAGYFSTDTIAEDGDGIDLLIAAG